jgi:K+:H+ antiporter subunit KhtT
MASAWVRRNAAQLVEVRSGAGSVPASLRVSRTVDAATLIPRTSSSPWMRYDFTTRRGERFAVVTRRSGDVEFMTYVDDPDAPVPLWRLDAEEPETVAEVLGAPRIAERFADLTKEIPGLGAGQVPVTGSSPHAGRPLGDTRARTLTGASIVAVVRGATVMVSPSPDEILRAGDVLVVIGIHEGISGVQSIISG